MKQSSIIHFNCLLSFFVIASRFKPYSSSRVATVCPRGGEKDLEVLLKSIYFYESLIHDNYLLHIFADPACFENIQHLMHRKYFDRNITCNFYNLQMFEQIIDPKKFEQIVNDVNGCIERRMWGGISLLIALHTERNMESKPMNLAYIDYLSILRGPLSEVLGSRTVNSESESWISVSLSQLPDLLPISYCSAFYGLTIQNAFFYKKEMCDLSAHLLIFHTRQSLEKYEKIITFVEMIPDLLFNLSVLRHIWLTDSYSITILPCQWSSFLGCNSNGSNGAYHPSTTPASIYSAFQGYLSLMPWEEDVQRTSAGMSTGARSRCLHERHMYYFDSAHHEEFDGDLALKKLLNLMSPLIVKYALHQVPLVIDVGACRGAFVDDLNVSVPLRLYSFEASPTNARYLREIYGNSMHVVTVVEMAVSDYESSNGRKEFFYYENEITAGRLQRPTKHTSEKPLSVEVEVVALDSYFANRSHGHLEVDSFDGVLPNVTILKLDLEGYDTLALLGAPVLLSITGIVVFECHSLEERHNGGPGTTQYQVSQYLHKLGFDVFKIGTRALIEFGGDAYSPIMDVSKYWSNCLAIKKNHFWKANIFSNYLPQC